MYDERINKRPIFYVSMSFRKELKGLFHKEKCERAINYDKRTLEIKAKAEVPGITFSLDGFKTEYRKSVKHLTLQKP